MGFKYPIERTPPKIIQISCDEFYLYALTDKNEIWKYGSDWNRIPPLPTEDEVEVEVESAE
jgi:hypothetical protein